MTADPTAPATDPTSATLRAMAATCTHIGHTLDLAADIQDGEDVPARTAAVTLIVRRCERLVAAVWEQARRFPVE